MKHYNYYTGIVVLALCSFVVVDGRAHVQVLLKSYTNVHNTMKDTGKCCKDSSTTSSCTSCDPYIEMFIAENPTSKGVNISNVVTTDAYKSSNTIDFSASIARFVNPFNLSFDTFKSSIDLVFRIHDKSSEHTHSSNIMDEILFNAGQGEPHAFASNSPLTTVDINGTSVNMKFEYSLQCDNYYYGEQCQTYCKPIPGQYSCTSSGKKQCETGVSGTNCDILADTHPCHNNTCQHGSTCQRATTTTYTCACAPMFSGTYCETRLTTTTQTPVSTSQMDSTSNSTSSEQSRFLDGVTKETLFAVTCSVAGILLVLIISVTVIMCRMYKRWKISDVKSTQKA